MDSGVYTEVYNILRKMGCLQSTENILKEPWFAIRLGKTTYLLLQPSHMKAELPIGITHITNIVFKGCSVLINV